MKKIITALFIGLSLSLYAQQDPLYSQYLNNPIVLNPAYAGINNLMTVSAGYRGQWSGLEGAPTTFFATGHSSFLDNQIGAGLTIIRDEIGISTNTQVNISGAYKIDFGGMVLSFGLQTGINNYNETNNELSVRDANDDLFSGDQSFTKVNFGAGAILKGEKFFVGLSVPRLANSKEEIGNVEQQVFERHYYLGLGYVSILNANMSLKTGALIKALADAPASVDLSASVIFLDKYSAGVLTRNFNTYGLLLNASLKENLRFGYTFEVPTDASIGTQFNTHELTLSVDLELFTSHSIGYNYF